MAHDYLLWVCTMAYGIHMIEETVYNWRGWVRRVLKMPAEWSEFYLVNAIVGLLGISCAMIGWREPAVSLIFPAFMVVNAILFHIAPTIVTRIFSPGVITAVILFLPITAWTYWGAYVDGVLTVGNVLVSSVLGFFAMWFPIVVQLTKNRPFFVQPEA